MASKARRKQRTSPRPARAARVTAPARDGAPAASAPPGRAAASAPPGRAAASAPPGRAAASASGAQDPAPEQPPEPAGGWIAAVEHETMGQVLMATCWLDPGEHGPAGTVTVRFTGRRAGITGAPGRGDRFEREEIVEGVLPGSGPVSVTTRVTSVTPGEWLVRARVVARPGQLRTVRQLGPQGSVSRAHVLRRILWPKGNPVAAEGPGTQVSTRMAALATGPGIVFASWSATVAAGVVLALGLLVVLLGRVHIGTGPALAVSAAVILAGIIGARAWYVMLQRGKTEGPAFRGLCIQGTVAGGALAAVPGLLLAGIPAGTFFDAAAPGLFFAMAIGRQGCFLTGCCVGRPTASRFGIWSSDGHMGVRRLPAQQLESLTCLMVGAGALAAFLATGRAAGGAVFAAAMAAYILARQGLLSLRAEPRRWSLARPVTLAAAAAALAADIAVAALR